MRVWIDQDLCTGDGLCTDHCPDVFVLLEDGISYVHHPGKAPEGGGSSSVVSVAPQHEAATVAAAIDCPGECIFLHDDQDQTPYGCTDDIVDADVVPIGSRATS